MAKDLQEDTDKDYIRLHIGGLSADVTEKDLRDRYLIIIIRPNTTIK